MVITLFIFSERPVQTTLQSSVSEPNQITYKTCFWELPDEARNELALLANFIAEQTDKHDKIAEEINSSFGPELDDLGVRALTIDNVSYLESRKRKENPSIFTFVFYRTLLF